MKTKIIIIGVSLMLLASLMLTIHWINSPTAEISLLKSAGFTAVEYQAVKELLISGYYDRADSLLQIYRIRYEYNSPQYNYAENFGQ